ncbi:MAG: glycoside-pentoside-hexuronide (GPH):cation symporter [Clostridiales bacterium]|nr:glycoside-pentoside-hexuronide (GPH):cation symporter [Clostridiales bacterium]
MSNKTDPGRLSWNERIAYFVGYTGIIITYFFISTYFLIFLTNTYGLSSMVAGLIITLARFWDAVNDPMIGVLTDRTRTKLGCYRPWLFGFCIPVAFLCGLCFTAPNFSVAMKTVYIAIIYILFGMSHTCINMPAGTLANVMTTSYSERGVLGAARELGSNIGQLICQNLGAVLLVAFCGTGAYTAAGYMKTAWILGAISIPMVIYCAVFCKERIQPSVERVSFKESLGSLFKNKKALNLGVVGFCFMIFLFFRLSWQTYFCIYYLGDSTLIAPLLSAMNLPPIIILFLAPAIINKIGKKNVMILGGGLIVVGGILFAVAQTNIALLYISSVVLGIGQSFPLTAVWAALPDAADYGEYKFKTRAPAIIYTYGTFMVKMGQAITALVAGWILTGIGYDGTAAVQTAGATHGIYMANWIMIVLGGALVILTSLPYNLTKEEHAEIIKELETRRNA